jgi:predicted nuclease with TOPRIM domain
VDDAERIRREAEEYAEATRRRADAFAEARIHRLRELTDRLIATAETVDRRFGEALALREQLEELAAALGAAAERAVRELDDAPLDAPPPPRRVHVQDVRGTSPPPPLS